MQINSISLLRHSVFFKSIPALTSMPLQLPFPHQYDSHNLYIFYWNEDEEPNVSTEGDIWTYGVLDLDSGTDKFHDLKVILIKAMYNLLEQYYSILIIEACQFWDGVDLETCTSI